SAAVLNAPSSIHLTIPIAPTLDSIVFINDYVESAVQQSCFTTLLTLALNSPETRAQTILRCFEVVTEHPFCEYISDQEVFFSSREKAEPEMVLLISAPSLVVPSLS